MKWVILTEHIPWLGLDGSGVDALLWEEGKARRNWNHILDVARQTSSPSLRILMGEEMGTAAGASATCGGLSTLTSGPGHYGVYTTPDIVNNTVFDCLEDDYLKRVNDQGAWGGANHPENGDGGSDWHCYFDGDFGLTNTCLRGVADWAPNWLGSSPSSASRTYEIINDKHLPTAGTLANYDLMLGGGGRIAVVGGSDGHTSPTKITSQTRCVPVPLPPFFLCAPIPNVEQVKSNDGKIGLIGRTYASINSDRIASGSTDPLARDNPVRQALATGQTVSSTGPLIVPHVGRNIPGNRITVANGNRRLRLRVDWPTGTVPVLQNNINGLDPAAPAPTVPINQRPSSVEVRIVPTKKTCYLSQGGCPTVAVVPADLTVSPGENWANIDLTLPSSSQDFSIYVVAKYPNSPFPGGDLEHAAIASPIFVTVVPGRSNVSAPVAAARSAALSGPGLSLRVTDGAGAAVSTAVAELQKAGTDGTFRPLDAPTYIDSDTEEVTKRADASGLVTWALPGGSYQALVTAPGCRAQDGRPTVIVAVPSGGVASAVLDCTVPTTAPLRVEARLLRGSALAAGTYAAICIKNGQQTTFGPASLPFEATTEIAANAPVGATCTVTQLSPGGALVIGRTAITDLVSPSGLTVQFVNTVTRGPANFALIATSDEPSDDGREVPFTVTCPSGTVNVIANINQSVRIEGDNNNPILDGDVCTVRYRGAGLELDETRTRTVRAVGLSTEGEHETISSVEFQFAVVPQTNPFLPDCSLCVFSTQGSGFSSTGSGLTTIIGGPMYVASPAPAAVSMTGSTRIILQPGPLKVVGGVAAPSNSIDGPIETGTTAVQDELVALPIPTGPATPNTSSVDWFAAPGVTGPPARADGQYRDVSILASGTFRLPAAHQFRSVTVGSGATLLVPPGFYGNLRTIGTGAIIAEGGTIVVFGEVRLTGSGTLTLNSASLYLTCRSANGMDPRSCNQGEPGATLSLAGSYSVTSTQTSPLGLAIRYHPNNGASLEMTGSGMITLGQNGIYAPRSELRMTGSASLGAKTLGVGSVRLTGSPTLRVGSV